MTVVNRPETRFDGASHKYDVEGWEGRTMGVSSVAKVGEAEDSFGIGAAWGFRVGYEGAVEVYLNGADQAAKDDMRGRLQAHGLTPWSKRDQAAKRGNWVHDTLEVLASTSATPTADILAAVSDEYQGHAHGVLQWFLDHRPSFVSTEVQVASVEHGFAGRYDIRCTIEVDRLYPILTQEQRRYLALKDLALCLVDLKTSKRIYPTSHFPQLEGYEGASVEMGFPPTDLRLVLNTHPDGTYEFAASYATYDDFLSYLGALRAIKRIKSEDPEAKRKVALEKALVSALPALSRDLALQLPECAGFDAAGVGKVLGGLRKRGLVEQLPDRRWSVVVATS